MKLRHLLLALPLAAGLSMGGAVIATAQGVQAFAVLLGGNEPPSPGTDLDGYGAAALTFHNPSTICVVYVVDRIGKPNAAHIHKGKAGVNGPPVIALPIPASGNPGQAGICIDDVAAGLFAQIRNSPSDFYLNVHTSDFGGGAVRGQLF